MSRSLARRVLESLDARRDLASGLTGLSETFQAEGGGAAERWVQPELGVGARPPRRAAQITTHREVLARRGLSRDFPETPRYLRRAGFGGDVTDVADISYFFAVPGPKADNDRANKIREAAIMTLISDDPTDRDRLKSDAKSGGRWSLLEARLLEALAELPRINAYLDEAVLVGTKPKGGRRARYDFEATYRANGEDFTVPLEFKRGSSIYNQPQFLSLYARAGELTSDAVESFAEFFADNYAKQLAELLPQGSPSVPDRSTYLSLVYDNRYEVHPFFQALYDDHGHLDRERRRKALAATAGDAYLKTVFAAGHGAIAWDKFQRDLLGQCDKTFISWDTARATFVVERFERAQMQLAGTFDLLAGRDHKMRYLRFQTAGGGNIDAMLRWRNHSPVLLPAWQVSTKDNHRSR